MRLVLIILGTDLKEKLSIHTIGVHTVGVHTIGVHTIGVHSIGIHKNTIGNIRNNKEPKEPKNT